MPGRRFHTSTVNIERCSIANAAGTLQKIPTYAAVSGLTALEAAIKESSVNKVDLALVGDVKRRMVIINIDADFIPEGSEIRVGDRIKDTVLDQTYDVLEVMNVDSRTWQCRATYKVT